MALGQRCSTTRTPGPAHSTHALLPWNAYGDWLCAYRHRGTPLKDGVSRLVQNIEFKRADVEWITQWNPGWSKSAYGPVLSSLLSRLSVTQRCVLGFPAPAHPFWTAVRSKVSPPPARTTA